MNRRKIRDIIAGFFESNNITSAPVDVEALAKFLHIEIRKRDFEGALSGFAYQKHGQKIIGVNADEGPLRQRFTIAHELGHLYLDPRDDLNYDKNFAMQFRNGLSSKGTNLKEIEANYFAAELLMPEDFLRQDLAAYAKDHGAVDFEDNTLVKELAEKYKVSIHAMTVRLARLHYM
jgi:Zn-dependent peptidase ImmA (M78 family)